MKSNIIFQIFVSLPALKASEKDRLRARDEDLSRQILAQI
jgi:hypothetical protein